MTTKFSNLEKVAILRGLNSLGSINSTHELIGLEFKGMMEIGSNFVKVIVFENGFFGNTWGISIDDSTFLKIVHDAKKGIKPSSLSAIKNILDFYTKMAGIPGKIRDYIWAVVLDYFFVNNPNISNTAKQKPKEQLDYENKLREPVSTFINDTWENLKSLPGSFIEKVFGSPVKIALWIGGGIIAYIAVKKFIFNSK